MGQIRQSMMTSFACDPNFQAANLDKLFTIRKNIWIIKQKFPEERNAAKLRSFFKKGTWIFKDAAVAASLARGDWP